MSPLRHPLGVSDLNSAFFQILGYFVEILRKLQQHGIYIADGLTCQPARPIGLFAIVNRFVHTDLTHKAMLHPAVTFKLRYYPVFSCTGESRYPPFRRTSS